MALLGQKKDTTPAPAPAGQPGAGVQPAPTRRRRAQMGVVRSAGYLGVVGIATAVAAIMGTQDIASWIVGVVAACVTLVLTGILRRALAP